MLSIGDKIPSFNLPLDVSDYFNSSNNKGKNVILYFYPKDDTPGCTKEAITFSENLEAFEAENTIIFGVSRDTVKKHDKFIYKHNLKVRLLSDEDGKLCEAFGTWVEKKMYGKSYMGIERSTYLIDLEGKIIQIWRKVKVPGHIEDVLAATQALNA